MLRGKKSFTKRTLKRESVKKVWQRDNIGHFPSTLFLKGLYPWIKGGGEKRIYGISKRIVRKSADMTKKW